MEGCTTLFCAFSHKSFFFLKTSFDSLFFNSLHRFSIRFKCGDWFGQTKMRTLFYHNQVNQLWIVLGIIHLLKCPQQLHILCYIWKYDIFQYVPVHFILNSEYWTNIIPQKASPNHNVSSAVFKIFLHKFYMKFTFQN